MKSLRWFRWAGAPLLILACAHAERPDPDAYARALAEGRLSDAYALTSETYRGRTAFEAFSAEKTFERRAAQVEGLKRAQASAEAAAPELFGDPQALRIESAREVLRQFVQAAEARRFSAVWALLSSELRARYTPERLEREFFEQPLAAERIKRAREAAAGPAEVAGDEAHFAIGQGKAVVLRLEPDGFRVASLE